jgi:hypothetical protein
VQVSVDRLAWVQALPPTTHLNGDRTTYHTFACSWVAGEPAVGDDESLAARWCPVADLPAMRGTFLDRIACALADEPVTRFAA